MPAADPLALARSVLELDVQATPGPWRALLAAEEERRRLRAALGAAHREYTPRCHECDEPATWREDFGAGLVFWCDEHVEIPRKAASKGSGRGKMGRVVDVDPVMAGLRAALSPSASAASHNNNATEE